MGGLNLELKNTPKLTISPKLRQSIDILGMNALQLQQLIEERVLDNPFLEYEQPITDYKYEEDFQYVLDNKIQETNLYDYINTQIYTNIIHDKDRFIALLLTDRLDENGYIHVQLNEIAQQAQSDLEDVKRILLILQTFEPTGVFATDLKQCLELQLKEHGKLSVSHQLLLANLDLLAKGELKQLMKILNVNSLALSKIIADIKSLDPKPGRNFSPPQVQTMIPEAFIEIAVNEQLKVRLNDKYLPTIKPMDRLFQNTMNCVQSEADISFCKQKYNEAKFLEKAVRQRMETLYSALNVIINIQSEFFKKGIEHLQPMILTDVARRIGCHESTISRLGNKIICTPIGTFEIKRLFTSKLKATFMENIYSSSAVKNMIKDIIAREGEITLSDEKIAQVLRNKGIDIARRTVSKYREAMKIHTSNLRKTIKN